jgi:type II secretory pathway component PulF
MMKIRMIVNLGFVQKIFFNAELVNVFRSIGYVMENGIVRMQVMNLVCPNNGSVTMSIYLTS